MTRDFSIKTALMALAVTAFAVPAAAQSPIRVDTRIHSSSGSCSQCDLSNKRMNGMKLKNANFSGSIFNNSNLSGGNFDGSNLTGSHFRKALLYGVEGQNVNLNGANLEDATLTEAKLAQSLFIGTNFQRADLTRGDFTDGDFRKTSFERATATEANFQNGNFTDAKLNDINLHKANLDGGHFNGVTFGNAIMLDATMMATDISDADLSMTQGLKQDQLNAACGNMNTRLPYELSVPYCEGTLTAEMTHDHDKLDPETVKAVKHIERAIADVEDILKATPTTDRALRRKLQGVHSDLVHSRRMIER